MAPTAPPPDTAGAPSAEGPAQPAALTRGLRPLAPALAPVTRPLRWLVGVISPMGWACFLLLGCCLLAGARLGWQEAWSAAAVLGFIAVTAWIWLIPRGGHEVSHNLLEPRVTVGDHALIRVTVANPTARPLLPVRMEMPVGQGQAVFVVPTLAPRARHERGFVLPTQRRSVVKVGPVVSVSRDPVGLLHSERARTRAQLVHIHPRTLRLGTNLRGILRDVEGAVTQDLSSSDVSFHALRDYVPGDDRRNIHWRTTARTGRLMVRQFEETRRSSLLVLLSTREEDYAGAEDFETAVSIACSLALEAIGDGREVHLLTQDGPLPTATALRLLDASCLIELGQGETSDLLTRRGCVAHPESSIVILVTGQEVSTSTLVRARAHAPLSMVMFTLRSGQRPLSRLHAGTLPVVDLDRLEQLPIALRRAL